MGTRHNNLISQDFGSEIAENKGIGIGKLHYGGVSEFLSVCLCWLFIYSIETTRLVAFESPTPETLRHYKTTFLPGNLI